MEIKSIDFVSTLQWKCINDECLICNNSIGDNCIKCDQLICNTKNCLSIMNDNSACKHSFHLHCLYMFQKNSNSLKCPMCNIEWVNK
jgi:hypothetical protein